MLSKQKIKKKKVRKISKALGLADIYGVDPLCSPTDSKILYGDIKSRCMSNRSISPSQSVTDIQKTKTMITAKRHSESTSITKPMGNKSSQKSESVYNQTDILKPINLPLIDQF